MKHIPLTLFAALLSLQLNAASNCCSQWTDLLDEDLSQWDVWLGIPHTAIEGMPEGTFQSDDVHNGTPIGLNNDPKTVFSVIEEDGDLVLKITGEVLGCISSKASFQNYHLQAQFKWGTQKWEPRLDAKRDSGILYHCHGEHGAFWKTWKACLECQVQEKDIGDFIPLAGPSAQFRGKNDGERWVFDQSQAYTPAKGYMHCQLEPDFPNGQWNTIDIYVLGDQAIHVVNGVAVMAIKDAVDANGNPLTSGEIQIQSEAAECYYKNVRMKPLKAFPKEYVKAVNL